jgi:2,3-diaminopropionate biosynthesis protein SbnB
MRDNMLIVSGQEVASLLKGRELDLINTVRMAYEAHGHGMSALPHSTFLRFPDNSRDRIIALPAYLGKDFEVAGIKWVSSFPDNIEAGMDRASAVVILNSMVTGRPEAIIEGSLISAKRTAASAALAARCLRRGIPGSIGMIGCGLINFEIARFLLAVWPKVKELLIHDLNASRAGHFKHKLEAAFSEVEVTVAGSVDEVLAEAPLISFATTALEPHVSDLSMCPRGSTILHISLRDLSPESILTCDNVVDDVDHVCRAQTSIHLAEQLTGNRDFIRCALPDILNGVAPAKRDDDSISVFSPFGLGILDLAVAKLVCDIARQQDCGRLMHSFFPAVWSGQAVT